MPHPDMPFRFDVVKEYATTFVYIALIFNLMIQATVIIQEKELYLRDAMLQMGLYDSSYWASWLMTNVVTNTISVLLMIVVDGLDRFLLHCQGCKLQFGSEESRSH